LMVRRLRFVHVLLSAVSVFVRCRVDG